MVRVGLAFLLVAIAAVSGGCGCGDVRNASSLTIEVDSVLAEGLYAAVVCIDDVCDTFSEVMNPGTSLRDGGWETELTLSDSSVYFASWRGIPEGEHRVRLDLTRGNDAQVSIDESVEFSEFRCSFSDSRATIAYSR